MKLATEQASAFAHLALSGIHREYPNAPGHVINNPGEVLSPRTLHPAFYGCFDWHSAVHSHWMLVRLLRTMPNLPEAQEIRAGLRENLTAEDLLVEKAYLDGPGRQSFERTYGWAWLLKLSEELHGWNDLDGKEWAGNLQPLADAFVARYLNFLPKQAYPIRVGTHPNTAFGISFALDYARAVGDHKLEELLLERAITYFAADDDYPAKLEPSGNDFFSPSLMEADLMRRVLSQLDFRAWFSRFSPGIAHGEPQNLLRPATVTDRTDPQIVHLDGLNLSRAWCMHSIASALPTDDPVRKVLVDAANLHSQAALPHIASGDYMGEHWLASFAVYLLT